ncbi:MAG: RNA polymerase sigma factor [Candidatus Xenobia bacterium]
MDHAADLRLPLARPAPVAASLGDRLKAGDEGAIEPFISAFQDAAIKLAFYMLHDFHEAQDVVQEAFMTALSEVRSLRDTGRLRSWLMRIVSNRCLTALRRRKAVVELPADLVSEENAAERTESSLLVRQTLAQLAPVDRTVLLMRDCLEMSYDEMATALQIPLGTVKSRLCEARRRLARRLMEDPS